MMMFWKTITFLWPFLKEMILGDKSLKEALKHHFWRVVLMAGILLSIALNFFTIPKLVKVSYDYVELKRNHNALIKQMHPEADVDADTSDAIPQHSGAVTPSPAASEAIKPISHDPPETDSYRQTKEFFDRLRAQERAGRY